MTESIFHRARVASARVRRRTWLLAMGAGLASRAGAQASASSAAPAGPGPRTRFDALVGGWSRSDGNYHIVVHSVGAEGVLQAMYFNPNPLPFSLAQARREGGAVHARFELQAGGYSGSNYELRLDPASDRLIGIYYQAVAKQSFEVQFMRR
jgi:hypothetical protein